MTIDVEQLVQDHKRAHHTEDGLEFHTVPSLLGQLREAIHGGATGDGAGAGGKAKLPFQAAAMDLYMLIEGEVWEAHASVFQRVNGAVHAEVLLTEWGETVDTDTPITIGGRTIEAGALRDRWVNLITEYLTPETVLVPIKLPCPSCSTRHHYRVFDGEQRRTDALHFRRHKTTGETVDARCEVCGAVWTPSQYMYFLKALSAGVKTTEENRSQ